MMYPFFKIEYIQCRDFDNKDAAQQQLAPVARVGKDWSIPDVVLHVAPESLLVRLAIALKCMLRLKL
jgi:hypothetical protein